MKSSERLGVLAIGLCGCWIQSGAAQQHYQLSLVAADGAQLPVAELQLAEEGPYQLQWDAALFSDHFLSMRPFKCLAAQDDTLWCRIPYPYANQRSIAVDLVDLEYDLLFVWKRSGEYGINLRNGLYFQLTRTESGFVGELFQVDLEALGIPPEPGNMRPIHAADLDAAEAESFAWPILIASPLTAQGN